MIEGINSSKKAFFAWLAVFVVLFVGLSVTWTVINNNSPVAEQATAEQMKMLYLGSFLFACLPLGWATRRKIAKWYAHVPTEEIQVFETNLVVALFRLGKCSFLFALNVALFTIYTAFAIVAGPIMNLYTIISGIIFMCQKKI